MLSTGTFAPNFLATDHNGKPLEFFVFGERWTLLWWFPAANEPGSQAQANAFTSIAAAFETADCDIIGISFDSVEDNKSFHEQNALPFKLLSDPEHLVGNQYRATREQPGGHSKFARRISYLIDPEGCIVQNYEVTDPSGHAAAVLSDLKAAQR